MRVNAGMTIVWCVCVRSGVITNGPQECGYLAGGLSCLG